MLTYDDFLREASELFVANLSCAAIAVLCRDGANGSPSAVLASRSIDGERVIATGKIADGGLEIALETAAGRYENPGVKELDKGKVRRVAELLVSDDPRKFSEAIQIVADDPALFEALRRATGAYDD